MSEAATLEREDWLLVEQAFPELNRQAEMRTERYLGGLALASEVTVEHVNESTLMAAIQEARFGDQASRRVVENNVATDVAERLFKVATQSRVHLSVENGVFEQEGRQMTDIHRNTLVHTVLNPEMKERTIAQLKNGFVFEELLHAGTLETHNALVFEPCPEDESTRKDYNFFTQTDSLSMQLLMVDGTEAVLETALVAGKKTPDSQRHDIATIYELAAQKGVELVPAEINGIVRYVMLVPKDAGPQAVEQVVADFDEINGTFYGQAEPASNYSEYAQACYERNESFEDIVQRITNQLLSEAHAFESPLEAIERLDYLSERFCVKRAQTDISIDAIIFGAESAAYIEQARAYSAGGDEVSAEQAMVMAQKTANSGSCPLFKGEKSGNDDSDDGPEKSESKWMKCPHCEAKVFADPCASYIGCWDCKAKVIDGFSFKGNGGSKKRREEQAKKIAMQKQAQAELVKV